MCPLSGNTQLVCVVMNVSRFIDEKFIMTTGVLCRVYNLRSGPQPTQIASAPRAMKRRTMHGIVLDDEII